MNWICYLNDLDGECNYFKEKIVGKLFHRTASFFVQKKRKGENNYENCKNKQSIQIVFVIV